MLPVSSEEGPGLLQLNTLQVIGQTHDKELFGPKC